MAFLCVWASQWKWIEMKMIRRGASIWKNTYLSWPDNCSSSLATLQGM